MPSSIRFWLKTAYIPPKGYIETFRISNNSIFWLLVCMNDLFAYLSSIGFTRSIMNRTNINPRTHNTILLLSFPFNTCRKNGFQGFPSKDMEIYTLLKISFLLPTSLLCFRNVHKSIDLLRTLAFGLFCWESLSNFHYMENLLNILCKFSLSSWFNESS